MSALPSLAFLITICANALTAPAEPVELSAEEKAAWGLTAPLVDLAGDGKLVPSPAYAAKIIADMPGLQWPDTVMENNETGWCVLYGMEEGKRKEIWRSEKLAVYQGPHPIVADANADGQLEAPSPVEEFILADTDGDGALEAVLSGADGLLRGVDGGVPPAR